MIIGFESRIVGIAMTIIDSSNTRHLLCTKFLSWLLSTQYFCHQSLLLFLFVYEKFSLLCVVCACVSIHTLVCLRMSEDNLRGQSSTLFEGVVPHSALVGLWESGDSRVSANLILGTLTEDAGSHIWLLRGFWGSELRSQALCSLCFYPQRDLPICYQPLFRDCKLIPIALWCFFRYTASEGNT